MCDYCRGLHCHPMCPNFDHGFPVAECKVCKDDIYDGEECFVGWISGEKYIFHPDCLYEAIENCNIEDFDFEPYKERIFEIDI